MKVICINAGKLKSKDGTIGTADGLIEGRNYNAEFKKISRHGDICYFITETQDLKQCRRFIYPLTEQECFAKVEPMMPIPELIEAYNYFYKKHPDMHPHVDDFFKYLYSLESGVPIKNQKCNKTFFG